MCARMRTHDAAVRLQHCCYSSRSLHLILQQDPSLVLINCCYLHVHLHARTQMQDNEESTEQLLELLDALITVEGDAPEKWNTLRRAVVTLVNNNCVLAAPQLPPRSSLTAFPTAVPTAAVTSESVTVSDETAADAGADGVGSGTPSASDIAVSTTHSSSVRTRMFMLQAAVVYWHLLALYCMLLMSRCYTINIMRRTHLICSAQLAKKQSHAAVLLLHDVFKLALAWCCSCASGYKSYVRRSIWCYQTTTFRRVRYETAKTVTEHTEPVIC
jgi:hypothetical protein